MIILGIDPGNARLGYGIIETKKHGAAQCLAYGCIETAKGQPEGRRLAILEKKLLELIATHKPEMIGVERLFFFRNKTTVMPVSQAKGVVLLTVAKAGIPVHEFTPPQVKSAVVGYGKATKIQVQGMVQRILQLKELPKPDDAADALAVAIACSALGDSKLK